MSATEIFMKIEGVPVRLEGLYKEFMDKDKKVVAIDDVNFTFPQGKIVTLLGPSGCGKTTTLRCIAGFYEPDRGKVFIGDKDMTGIPPYHRPTGTVFQNYALFPHMSVFENVAYGLRVKKLGKEDIYNKVMEGLRLLQLQGMEERYPSQLSGGQQQRVSLARVLVTRPKVLLMDEPLSNLDAKLRTYMRGEIKTLQQDLGVTMIYVTHDQEEAMTLSDEVAVMNQGRIEQIGSPEEIYHNPKSHFVADFIGEANFFMGEVLEVFENYAQVKIKGFLKSIRAERVTDKPYSEGDSVEIVIRPQAVSYDDENPCAKGTIRWSAFAGVQANYMVNIGEEDLLFYEHNPGSLKVRNDEVCLRIKRAILL